MKSEMKSGRKGGRLMMSLSVIALTLAACNKRADQITANQAETQPVEAPPLAALPLATADAPELAAAPEANQLPWPKQRIRVAQRPRYERYGYIDSAYDMGYAFADTPPDYTVDYDGIDPWIWRSGDGAYRIVEWLPYGERDYYYAPGDAYPFFVSDPYYSYAYDDDLLVGIYDPYGYAIDYGYDDPRFYNATRYYRRAGDLYHAAIYYPRRSAYAEDWISHRDYLGDRQRRWGEQIRRDPDWRQWRARNERDQQRQWQPERDQRLRYAMTSAGTLGAVRERMQRQHRGDFGQQRFASLGDRGGRQFRGQQQQFQRQDFASRQGREFGGQQQQLRRQAFAGRQGRDGRFTGNGFVPQRQARDGRQARFAGSSFFEQRRAARQGQNRSFGTERMGRQDFAGRQQGQRFADRSVFQQRRAMQQDQRGWRNRDQGFRMDRTRYRAEASRQADWGRQRQMFEGRRMAERSMRTQFEGRQRRQSDMMAQFQQRQARQGFEVQRQQWHQQRDNPARAWQGMQQRMAQRQERPQFHQMQQAPRQQDFGQRFAQARGGNWGGGGGGGGHWGGGGGGSPRGGGGSAGGGGQWGGGGGGHHGHHN